MTVQLQPHPANDMLDLETWRKRLTFRAHHRGSKELDILFMRFVDKHLATLTEAQMHALEALMAVEDTDCYNWLMGKTPPAPEHADMITLMRADYE